MELSDPSRVSGVEYRASGEAATTDESARERMEVGGFEGWSEKERECLGLSEEGRLQRGRRESVAESEVEAAMARDKQQVLGYGEAGSPKALTPIRR